MPSLDHKRDVATQYSWTDFAHTLEFDTYIITKGIILFFMFYGTMNWWYYKRLGDDIKKEEEKNKK
jgi:hypothetical protein